MKLLLAVCLIFSSTLWASQTKSSETTEATPIEKLVNGPSKKERKKKMEICGECGKPEVNCDCHHDEEKK